MICAGVVQLAGRALDWAPYQKQVSNIRVGTKGRQIHVLHATDQESSSSVRVASYRLHYADGETAELPITYGEDLRDWWTVTGESKETPNASVVWTGHTPKATAQGETLRLWKRT